MRREHFIANADVTRNHSSVAARDSTGGSLNAETERDRTMTESARTRHAVEFSAVIQEIVVAPDAILLKLDAAALDIAALADLVDRELAITARLADPSAQPKPTKHPTPKGTPECA